jgi:hypothetical protein
MFMPATENITKEETKPIRSQKSEMQFGNTTYKITTSFNEQARETVEQKLLQLVSDRISSEINAPKTLQNSGEMAESLT